MGRGCRPKPYRNRKVRVVHVKGPDDEEHLCGHNVEVECFGNVGQTYYDMDHPWKQGVRQYVIDTVRFHCGEEYVHDIDWDGCAVVEH